MDVNQHMRAKEHVCVCVFATCSATSCAVSGASVRACHRRLRVRGSGGQGLGCRLACILSARLVDFGKLDLLTC